MPPKSSERKKRYIFTLDIDVYKVERLYGLESDVFNTNRPENTTDLLSMVSNETVYSYMDETKRLHKCNVSVIKYDNPKQYRCFWDKYPITDDFYVACPLLYNASSVTKNYYSDLHKENYSLRESITEGQRLEIEEKGDMPKYKLVVEKVDTNDTDGIFCRFECCLAYIRDNKHNPIYRDSEMLLNVIYDTVCKGVLHPAPHWRKLKVFGGCMTIDEFRNSFGKSEYVSHGFAGKFSSILYLSEEKLKI